MNGQTECWCVPGTRGGHLPSGREKRFQVHSLTSKPALQMLLNSSVIDERTPVMQGSSAGPRGKVRPGLQRVRCHDQGRTCEFTSPEHAITSGRFGIPVPGLSPITTLSHKVQPAIPIVVIDETGFWRAQASQNEYISRSTPARRWKGKRPAARGGR